MTNPFEPHDAIAPLALPAVEALENERGTRLDFDQAEAELRRLECRWDLRQLAMTLAIVCIPVAGNTLERPYYYAVFVIIPVFLAGFQIWWARTPRARAIKRVKQAVHDWLAFGPTARDA